MALEESPPEGLSPYDPRTGELRFIVADGVVIRDIYMIKQKKYDPCSGKKSWE